MSQKIKSRLLLTALSLLLFMILVYTRTVNLSWGLPYPFHPDERNIASAIQTLHCAKKDLLNYNFKECFNPHFFAYGQLPIYLAYFFIQVTRLVTRIAGDVQFNEAILALRYISALASLFTVQVLLQYFNLLRSTFQKHIEKEERMRSEVPVFLAVLLFIFSPGLIQFAHFGTTESLLMFFYITLSHLSTKIILQPISIRGKNNKKDENVQKTERFVSPSTLLGLGVLQGLALGTKLSSGLFVVIPMSALLYRFIVLLVHFRENRANVIVYVRLFLLSVLSVLCFLLFTLVFSFISSPHNFLSFPDFLSSMRYESDVAVGNAQVFYTRSFFQTTPVLFHATHVFPYVLGMGTFFLFIIGLLFLPWSPALILLRLSCIMYFIFATTIFAKWARFIAPILPHMILFSALMVAQMYTKVISYFKKSTSRFVTPLIIIFVFYAILPGIAFLSIYIHPDVRFVASRWMRGAMQRDVQILQETANVIDLPIFQLNEPPMVGQIHNTSFNYYDLDVDTKLQENLKQDLKTADYIIIPSRRIFKNHTCLSPETPSLNNRFTSWMSTVGFASDRCRQLEKTYPKLNEYYRDLFNQRSGYVQVATFSSYPRIELFGKTVLSYPDEDAEETWTVFDHPVIRIYKKVGTHRD